MLEVGKLYWERSSSRGDVCRMFRCTLVNETHFTMREETADTEAPREAWPFQKEPSEWVAVGITPPDVPIPDSTSPHALEKRLQDKCVSPTVAKGRPSVYARVRYPIPRPEASHCSQAAPYQASLLRADCSDEELMRDYWAYSRSRYSTTQLIDSLQAIDSFTSLHQAGYPRPLAVPALPAHSAHNGSLPTSVILGDGILCSGLCGVEREARSMRASAGKSSRAPAVLRLKTGFGEDFITYTGMRLTQRHMTALMYLSREAAGLVPGEALELDGTEFVKLCGWSNSKYSRKMLWAYLLDWRGAVVVGSYQTAEEKRQAAESILGVLERSFYGKSPEEREKNEAGEHFCFTAAFSKCGMDLFRGIPIAVSLKNRAKLNEGLETWIYQMLRGSRLGAHFEYEHLREMSGTKQPLKEFARDVRRALCKMVTPGTKVIWEWSPEGKGVRVWKRRPTNKKMRIIYRMPNET